MDHFSSAFVALLCQTFIEFIGCTVARPAFPLLSVGRIRVRPFNSLRQRFNWLGHRWDESGRIEREESVAGLMGLFFLLTVLLAIALLFRLTF